MNPEYERPVKKNTAEVTSHDPATAVGELFYGPESLKLTANLLDIAGYVLSSAIGGTMRMALITQGAGVQLNSETPSLNPQSMINAGTGGVA